MIFICYYDAPKIIKKSCNHAFVSSFFAKAISKRDILKKNIGYEFDYIQNKHVIQKYGSIH